MRITIVHYSYWPVIGGVEWVIEQHAKLFRTHGHSVQLFESGAAPDLTGRLRQALSETDVLFAHNVLAMPFDPALAAALAELAPEFPSTRFVNWIHDIAACNPAYPDAPAPLAPAGFIHVAISELRHRQFVELTGAPCAVVPNGIDPIATLGLSAPLDALVREQRLLERDLVFLQPARLLKRKNIELTIRTAAALKAHGVSCAFLVTAPPDPHNKTLAAEHALELRELRAQLRLEKEILLLSDFFAVTNAELPGLYGVADGLFYPSWQEGFGIPVLEAAIHRVPVFCADIEPLRTLCPQATRFPPDMNPSTLARLLVETTAASEAIQRRKTIVREHSWDAIHNQFLQQLIQP